MSTNPVDMNSDLPPRSWRRWWGDLPGWFRIGFWALLACLGLQILIAVRIAIGLIEPAEITALRRPGIHIIFASDRQGEPFRGFNRLLDGMKGRSSNDVVAIRLGSLGTDDDLKQIGTHFPNLEDLYLTDASISAEGLRHLRSCKKLSELDLSETDVDDEAVKVLEEFSRLGRVHLQWTLVTNASIPALEGMAARNSLQQVNVAYTDISLAAIQAWRTRQTGRGPVVLTEKDQVPDGIQASIRWADGIRSRRFRGVSVVGIRRPSHRGVGGMTMTSSTLNHFGLWRSPQEFAESGEYLLTLKLGNHDAEPVVVTITDGKPSTTNIEFRMPVTKEEAGDD